MLRDRLPSLAKLTLAEALEKSAAHATIVRAKPATKKDVDALEKRLDAKLPADLRAFFLEIGGLEITGLAPSAMTVFSAPSVEPARAALRAFCDKASPEGWRDHAIPEGYESETRDDSLEEMGDELGLLDEHLEPFFDDTYDELRLAYRSMIPLIQHTATLENGLTCLGPHAQLYTVNLKSSEIAASKRKATYTSLFLDRLGELVIGN